MLVMQPASRDRFGDRPASFHPLALEAARAAFMIETDPTDESRRLLQQIKNEFAADRGMLAFRIKAQETQPGHTAARIAFEPQHHPLSVRQFRLRQTRSFNSARAEAIEFVRGLLGSAPELNRLMSSGRRATRVCRARRRPCPNLASCARPEWRSDLLSPVTHLAAMLGSGRSRL